jgi:Spy/CpxP family protein refolding chaperone
MNSRLKTRLAVWSVVAGVFVLGCVTGASLNSVYLQKAGAERTDTRARRDKQALFEEMRRALNLDEAQSAEIRTIIDRTREDYRALRSDCRPRYDALRQNARTRIRALLTPEQQKLFDARNAERDAQRGEDDKGWR